jgi:hypothetical protein
VKKKKCMLKLWYHFHPALPLGLTTLPLVMPLQGMCHHPHMCGTGMGMMMAPGMHMAGTPGMMHPGMMGHGMMGHGMMGQGMMGHGMMGQGMMGAGGCVGAAGMGAAGIGAQQAQGLAAGGNNGSALHTLASLVEQALSSDSNGSGGGLGNIVSSLLGNSDGGGGLGNLVSGLLGGGNDSNSDPSSSVMGGGGGDVSGLAAAGMMGDMGSGSMYGADSAALSALMAGGMSSSDGSLTSFASSLAAMNGEMYGSGGMMMGDMSAVGGDSYGGAMQDSYC